MLMANKQKNGQIHMRVEKLKTKECLLMASLVVQGLRPHVPNARGPGFILGHVATSHLRQLRVCWQFSSVAQSCPTLGDPMNRSTPGLPVHP